MEAMYRWVGNLVGYLIFTAVLFEILPSRKYEKYLRLFAGCILILLILQPFTESLRLEESLSSLFQSYSFEAEAGELRAQLDGAQQERLARLMDGYEEAAAQEAVRMAREAGFEAADARVWLERDEKSASFARVRGISLTLGKEPDQEPGAAEPSGAAESPGTAGASQTAGTRGKGAIRIDPVAIGDANPARTGGDGQAQQPAAAPARAAPDGRVRELKKRLAVYYQVEEGHVEIRMEDGSGLDPGQ